jgi:exonuclease III
LQPNAQRNAMPPGAHPLGSPAANEDREDLALKFTITPTLTVATFNVGLLRVRLAGGPTIFCNPALVNERLPFVGQALLQLDADVLALQEVYEEAHVRLICEALSGKYPHVARRVRRHLAPWKCNNGLMLLSRYPLLDVELHVHRHAALLEHMMGSKCFLTAVVDAPLGRIFVANTHLTAGGASHPEKYVQS